MVKFYIRLHCYWKGYYYYQSHSQPHIPTPSIICRTLQWARSVCLISRKVDAMVGLDSAATNSGGKEGYYPFQQWGAIWSVQIVCMSPFSQSYHYKKKITYKYWPVLWTSCVLTSKCFSLIYNVLTKISSLQSCEQNEPFSTWPVLFFPLWEFTLKPKQNHKPQNPQYICSKHLGLCMHLFRKT